MDYQKIRAEYLAFLQGQVSGDVVERVIGGLDAIVAAHEGASQTEGAEQVMLSGFTRSQVLAMSSFELYDANLKGQKGGGQMPLKRYILKVGMVLSNEERGMPKELWEYASCEAKLRVLPVSELVKFPPMNVVGTKMFGERYLALAQERMKNYFGLTLGLAANNVSAQIVVPVLRNQQESV